MKKPIIGVMPLVDIARESYWMLPGYFERVMEAGGVPIMLPLTNEEDDIEKLLDMCDGILLTGGQDVTPQIYGEERLIQCGETCDARDIMDTMFLLAALKKDKPVLGICRGLQLLNAAMGGTLYQDIPTQHPSEITHCQKPPYSKTSHELVIIPGSPLGLLLKKERIAVNSYHHQGIKVLAEGLLPMAISEDGIVESLILPDAKFVWAVQWHPEFMDARDETSKLLFKVFLSACGSEDEA